MYITTSRRDGETMTCVQHRCIRKRRRFSLSMALHSLFGSSFGNVLWRAPIPTCLRQYRLICIDTCKRVIMCYESTQRNHHIHQRRRTSENERDRTWDTNSSISLLLPITPPFYLNPATLLSSQAITLTHNASFPPHSTGQPTILSSHKLAGEPEYQPVSLSKSPGATNGNQSVYWPAMLAPRWTNTCKIPKALRPSVSTVPEKRMGTIHTRPLARSTWPALRKLTLTSCRARPSPMAACSTMCKIRVPIRRRAFVIILRLLGVIWVRFEGGWSWGACWHTVGYRKNSVDYPSIYILDQYQLTPKSQASLSKIQCEDVSSLS